MLLLLLLLPAVCRGQEERALAYLALEVRKWKGDNKCFSCHNNGDGARALYIARQLGRSIDASSLTETESWLSQPGEWKTTGANPGISDKVLAAIQFAAALKEREFEDRSILAEAASLVAGDQSHDGSWKIDEIGSPATYGTALATYIARTVLEAADPKRYASSIAKVNTWFAASRPASTPDIAAYVLAGRGDLAHLASLQNNDGGWGPWKNSPSEVFDTAIAMIALQTSPSPPAALARGRTFLLRSQLPSGGWTETTRPSGGQSYAQHISTTAWATIALLRTRAR